MLISLERQRNLDHSAADARADLDEPCGPRRIDVFATDGVHAVTHVGGWLYDQAARGWRVAVIVSDASDCRPLRILGVEVVDLDSALRAANLPRAQLIQAATELLKSDPDVDELVLSRLSHSPRDFAVWNGRMPRHTPDGGWTCYRLSAAATAFKRQALLAASTDPTTSDLAEEFWCELAAGSAPATGSPASRSPSAGA